MADGGALAGDPGTSMTVSGSGFVYNSAQGGGSAQGGAIKNVGASPGSLGFVNPVGLTISGSTFSYNLALGLNSSSGSGGIAVGGAVFAGDGANSTGGGFLALTGSQFVGNQAVGGSGGAAGYGGYADGGAVNSQPPLNLVGSTFGSNMARAALAAWGVAFNGARGRRSRRRSSTTPGRLHDLEARCSPPMTRSAARGPARRPPAGMPRAAA